MLAKGKYIMSPQVMHHVLRTGLYLAMLGMMYTLRVHDDILLAKFAKYIKKSYEVRTIFLVTPSGFEPE